jgi:hypothetical protein
MSNEFVALRARARQKRDRLVADAKREYEATLVQIAALEAWQSATRSATQ